jgi:DNA-binding NtrC family response regulator
MFLFLRRSRYPWHKEFEMAVSGDSLSVLVVDEDPEILSFFARILDINGMRALLARTHDEAVGIAKRSYVPIDLVLTDVLLKPDAGTLDLSSGPALVERLRELRPELRAMYMSASLDSEMIRIELMDRLFETMAKSSDDRGLLELIRNAATALKVQRAGSTARQ